MEVTIYLETTLHGPAKRAGAGMWLIEYIKKDGTEVTRQGTIFRAEATENSMCLELLRIALGRLTKSCSVRVNTRCEHILNSMENHWVPKWEKAGWIKSNGKPVANAMLWQQVYMLMKIHQVTVVNGDNSYLPAMKIEMGQVLGNRSA